MMSGRQHRGQKRPDSDEENCPPHPSLLKVTGLLIKTMTPSE
jgi:hypothetical protein